MIPVYVLAAGAGTRMFPYGELLPKALMPLGGKPFIRHIVDAITPKVFEARIGVLEQDLELFEHEFRDAPWVKFVTIPYPRGTAGILKDHLREEEETFVVWYGDCLIDARLEKVALALHGCDVQLVVNRNMPSEYGILDVKDGKVIDFREHSSLFFPFWTGIAACRTVSMLPYLGQDKDLARDVFPRMIEEGHTIRADVQADYFDIGTTQAYLRAKKALQNGQKLPGLNPGHKASLNLATKGVGEGR